MDFIDNVLDRLEKRVLEKARLERKVGRHAWYRNRVAAELNGQQVENRRLRDLLRERVPGIDPKLLDRREAEARALARGPLVDGPTEVLPTKSEAELEEEFNRWRWNPDTVAGLKKTEAGIEHDKVQIRHGPAEPAVGDPVDWQRRANDYALVLTQLRGRLASAEDAQRASKAALEEERQHAERLQLDLSQTQMDLSQTTNVVADLKTRLEAEKSAHRATLEKVGAYKGEAAPREPKLELGEYHSVLPEFGHAQGKLDGSPCEYWHEAATAEAAVEAALEHGELAFATRMYRTGSGEGTRLYKACRNGASAAWCPAPELALADLQGFEARR